MKDNLFNPSAYINDTMNKINPIIRGLLVDMSLETETTFPTSMRDFLFAKKGEFGKDLFAINIQRGREHGLGTYNDYRKVQNLNFTRKHQFLIKVLSNSNEAATILIRIFLNP